MNQNAIMSMQLTLVATGLLFFGSCQAVNDVLGTDVDPLTPSEEKQLGDSESESYISAYGGRIESATVQSYVNDVGQELARNGARKDVTWTFHVTKSPAVQHFSLPGGHVFVTQGILAELQNEAQLAAILAHEIGHVDAKHLVNRIDASRVQNAWKGKAYGETAQRADLPSELAGIDIDAAKAMQAVMPLDEEDGFQPRFDEDEELEATRTALRLLDSCNYRVNALRQVSDILSTSEGVSDVDALATHKTGSDFDEQVIELIKSSYDIKRGEFGMDAYKLNVVDELGELP